MNLRQLIQLLLDNTEIMRSRVAAILDNTEAVDFLNQENQFGHQYQGLLEEDQAELAKAVKAAAGLGFMPKK